MKSGKCWCESHLGTQLCRDWSHLHTTNPPSAELLCISSMSSHACRVCGWGFVYAYMIGARDGLASDLPSPRSFLIDWYQSAITGRRQEIGAGGGWLSKKEEGPKKVIGGKKDVWICDALSVCLDWLAAVAWSLMGAGDGAGWAVGGKEEQDDSGAHEKDVRRVLKRAAAAGVELYIEHQDAGGRAAPDILILILAS